MFKTYLNAAFRNIVKHRANTLINVIGLALGIAATIVIVLFAHYQLTYDQFHTNSENTYLVYKERLTPTGLQPTYDTWVPLLNRLQAEYPEVENGTRVLENGVMVEVNNERFEEDCYYVDPSYFEVFDFPLAQGNNQQPFTNLNSVIISKEMARKYFGDANPIGQKIRVNFEQEYIVSGVLEDYPQNGSVRSEMLFPIESVPGYQEASNDWGNSFLFTFITLPENSSTTSLSTKFPSLIENIWDQEVAARTNFQLLPLHDAYDTFVGDSSESYMLLYIALGIILIAATNYMNLSTARSLLRAKEIGMRKVLGANKRQLITQFMTEAVIVTMVALVLGVLFAEVTLPHINSLFDMDLYIPYLKEPQVMLLLIAFGLSLGILSGSYPAFFLSNFKILKSLRSNVTARMGKVSVRNVLIVFQFTISALLVISSITIARQLRFMQEADLAFNKENLLVIPVSENDFEDSEQASIRLETFRNELASYNSVISMSSSRHIPGRWSGSNTFVRPEGWEGDPLRMRFTYMDANFFDCYEINLLEGYGFLPDEQGDQRESVVINEAAMRAFGWEDIQDKAVMIGPTRIAVVGLIEDFNYETLRSGIDPILHFHRAPSNATHRYLSLRVTDRNLQETLSFVEDKWDILDPGRAFDYFLVEEDLQTMYENEGRLLSMVEVFSFLSIFISCLGLYGLLSFILDRKKKEIGVRKVLGASITNIMVLISKEFTKLVIIAFLLAVPIAYFFMNHWLEDFAYHTNLGWQIFFLTLLLSLGIAWSTIFFKSYKAATANPVHAIKDE